MPDARIEIRLFGRAEVVLGGAVVDRFPTRRLVALLAYLVLHPGWQPRERIAEALWPDQAEGKGLASLRNALSMLRRVLEPEAAVAPSAIEATRTHARLESALCASDVGAFRRAIMREDWAAAVDLYAGDLLDDVYDEWLEPFREALRVSYHSALAAEATRSILSEEVERAITLAERWRSSDPFDPQAHRTVVLALVAAGRRSDALQALRRLEEESEDPRGPAPFDFVELRRQIESSPPESRKPKLPPPHSPPQGEPNDDGARRLPPYLSRFFGRERETTRILEWATSPSPLLTVLGTGGVGKTRLAVEASLAGLTDGHDVRFVPLAAADSRVALIAGIMRSLEIREVETEEPEATVRGHLAGLPRSTILILDNVEQIVPVAAAVAMDLIPTNRRLKILCTSREPLGVEGEALLRLEPLRTSPESGEDLAVRLFVDRARNTRSDFALTSRNREEVAALCRDLEGLPLAIEIVAAWAGAWSVGQMRANVREREIVTRKRGHELRHRSLEACIDWSFGLLEPEAQSFLLTLSLFRGGWTLASAEAATGSPDASGLLASLVDRSLATSTEVEGELRFSMLESVRIFCRDRLVASEARAAAVRFAGYFADLAETKSNPCAGEQERLNQRCLDRERENFEAVVAMCEEGLVPVDLAATVAGQLHLHWVYRGQSRLGLALTERVLAVPTEEPPGGGRLLAFQAICVLARDGGDAAKVEKALIELRALAEGQDDKVAICRALIQAGNFYNQHGRFAEGLKAHREAVAVAAPLGILRLDAAAHSNVGESLMGLGRTAEAIHHWTIATNLDLAGGNVAGEAMLWLGFAEAAQGDLRTGAKHLRLYLDNVRGLEFARGYVRAVYYAAFIAAQMGRSDLASGFAGSARAFIAQEGYALEAIERKCLDVVDAACGPSDASARPIEEAIEGALLFLQSAATA